MEKDQPGNFICRFCKGSFTQAQHLYKHVQLIHAANPSTKTNRTCPICGTVFANYEGYTTHLRHIHGQRNEGQIFAFKCFNDFFLWKTELENRSCCKYSLHAAPKLLPSNEKIHVYQCDTALKMKKGSCSSLESCAAMICATESMKNHEIKVEYWNTHVGHSVQVEDDELNAAINSVQPPDESTMHVMDMLNSIDQSIETGAEVFVTETVEEVHSLSPVPKKSQKNIFNINKTKTSAITTAKNPPVVQNFSFKKDPSKKKESSIYSLASVACGKISANKTVKSTEKNISKIFQNSLKKSLQRNVISNPVSGENNIVNSISDLMDDNTLNHHIPKSSLQGISFDEQASPQKNTNKKEIVYNWPVGKPLPSDWRFSDPPSSEEKGSNNSKEKENISSISNKIIVPIGLEPKKKKEDKSLRPKTSQIISLSGNKLITTQLDISDSEEDKSLRPRTSKIISLSGNKLITKPSDISDSDVTTSATQFSKPGILKATPSPQNVTCIPNIPPAQLAPSATKSKQTSSVSASVAVTTNPTQFTKPGISLNTTPSSVSPQILNSIPSFNPAQLAPSVLPGAQTYISVNDKLIPYNPCVLPPNSNVLLPILSNPPTGSLLQTSSKSNSSASMGIRPSYQPSAVGIKQSTIAPLVGTFPTLSNSLPGSPFFLVPCTNNSAISSILHPGSSIASPLVLQSMTPSTSDPGSKMFIPSSFLKPVTTLPSQQAASLVKSPQSGQLPVTSSISNNLSNAVKVQKVSLPSASSSTSTMPPEKRNPVLTFSQPGQMNTAPISSTPTINIPKTNKAQKPGTFIFESSGELYMLEPLDDDLLVKTNNTPLTSTSKKVSDSSSLKRKRSEKNILQKPDKLKKLDTSQSTFSNISDETSNSSRLSDITKSNSTTIVSEEELDAPLYKFGRSILKKQNGVTIGSGTSESEMTIKIAPSQNHDEKEVSFFTKTTPSQLTVKTVPSFSLQQSRPVTSTSNSFRTLTSNSLTSSTPLSATSVDRSTPLLFCEKETSSIEESLQDDMCPSAQNVEVKRNVTIKSVVQDKRSITDDDLEVMKKVKFYKLEMKYLACQEQCKKLKIELAKALSKNKELLQDIEEKKGKNELEENNSNITSEHTVGKESTQVDESQKLILDENELSTDIQLEEILNGENQEERDETTCDVKSTFSHDDDDSDKNNLENAMNDEFDVPIQSDQVSNDQECAYNVEEKCIEQLDCNLEQKMDVDENKRESTDPNETKKEDTKDKTNPNTDVFTMVRTSVLKNLYLNIEDLTEEKNQLQKDLEEYKKLNINIVPFEEYEDS